MIPKSTLNPGEIMVTESSPSLTYRLEWGKSVRGYTQGLDSIEQAIYKILATERYEYLIYGHHWGIELKSLIGKERSFIEAEAPRRIKEALLQDDRIKDVLDFKFTLGEDKDTLFIEFTALTKQGTLYINREVEI